MRPITKNLSAAHINIAIGQYVLQNCRPADFVPGVVFATMVQPTFQTDEKGVTYLVGCRVYISDPEDVIPPQNNRLVS